MRKRRNKKNKQIYLVLLFVLFSLLLSTGYSLFSEILNTNGSVSLMPYVGGNVLNVNLLQTAAATQSVLLLTIVFKVKL